MSCSKSRICASPTIRTRGSASRWTPRSISIIPMAGRRSAGGTRSRRSTATTRWRSTGASTRRIMPSWSSPATSTPEEVKADAEETYGKIAPRAEDRAAASARRSRCRRRRAPSRSPIRASSSRASAASIWCPRAPRPSPARAKRSMCSPHILGCGENSRLYRALVVDQGIALNAGACYSTARRSTTPSSAFTARRSRARRCTRSRRHRRRAGRCHRTRRHRRRA